MNQSTARAILTGRDADWLTDWGKVHAEFKTPDGVPAARMAYAMARIHWIAERGSLEGFEVKP